MPLKLHFRFRPIILPIIILIAWFCFSQVLYPTPSGLNFDPEMAYLFSSMGFLQGHPITYIDHPGTPVQLIGSFLLALTWPVLKLLALDFVTFHFTHPEVFQVMARFFLLGCNIAALMYIERVFRIKRAGAALFLSAALASLYFAIHPYSLIMTTIWSHNAFNFSAGGALLALLYALLRKDEPLQWKPVLAVSFLAGVLTAFTVYFASWVVGILLAVMAKMFLGEKKVGKALIWGGMSGLAAVLGFFVATIPILPNYSRFLIWILNLATHQGTLGRGAAGMTPLPVMVSRFLDLLRQVPGIRVMLVIFAGLLILYLIGLRAKWIQAEGQGGKQAFLFGVTVQLLVCLFLVSKHPGLLYIIPAAVILPVLLACIFDLYSGVRPVPAFFSYCALGLVTVAIMLLAFRSGGEYVLQRQDLIRVENAIEGRLAAIAQDSGKRREDLNILRTYGLYSRCFALWFGNQYAGYQFNDAVIAVCRGDRSYDVFGGYVEPQGRLRDFPWDVIVTRERYLDELTAGQADRYTVEAIPFLLRESYGSVLIIH
jgi:hypothetical protein